jgi:hypothetical protein
VAYIELVQVIKGFEDLPKDFAAAFLGELFDRFVF